MTLWTYLHSSNKDPHLYNGKPIEYYVEEKPRALIVCRAHY